MPEKDGAEEKSTKSVVNKKQKLGEEGYDIARDMGKVRPSKDKKDATTMPPSKEMRKTQKVNKGPSALDIVKKKYKGQIMNVGKKKVKEELDLTQVAEAFGGYIVEKSEIRKIGKKTYFYPMKGEKTAAKEVVKKFKRERKPKDLATPDVLKPMAKPADPSVDPFDDDAEGKIKAKAAAKRDIEKEPETMDLDTFQGRQKFKEPTPKLQKKGSTTPIGTPLAPTTMGGEVKTTFDPNVIDPKFRKEKPIDPDEIRAARQFKKDLGGETALPGETEAGKSELKKTAGAKIEKPKPKPPKIGQFQGPQMTPLQKSKRFNRPSIADAENITGANPETGQAMFMRPGVLDKSGRPRRLKKASPVKLRQTRQAVKDMEDREKTIISPVTGGRLPADSPQALQYAKQSDDYKERVQGIDPKTGEALSPEERKRRFKGGSLATQNKGGPVTVVPKDRSIVSQSPVVQAIKKADKFVQRNPVLGGISGLAAYDVGKGIFSKIMNLRGPGLRGGTVGRRTAGTFTAT